MFQKAVKKEFFIKFLTLILIILLMSSSIYSKKKKHKTKKSRKTNILPFDFSKSFIKNLIANNEIIDFIKKNDFVLLYFTPEDCKTSKCNIINNTMDRLSKKFENKVHVIKSKDTYIFNLNIFGHHDTNNASNSQQQNENKSIFIKWYNNIDHEEIELHNEYNKAKNLIRFIKSEIDRSTMEIHSLQTLVESIKADFINNFDNSIMNKVKKMSSEEAGINISGVNPNLANTGVYLLFIGDKIKHKKQFNLIMQKAKVHFYNKLYFSNNSEFYKAFNINSDSYDLIAYRFILNAVIDEKSHLRPEDFPPDSFKLSEGERFYLTDEDIFNGSKLESYLDIFIADPLSALDSDTTYFLALEGHNISSLIYVARSEEVARNEELQKMLLNLTHKYFRKDLVFHFTWAQSAYFEILNLILNIEEDKLPALIFLKPNPIVVDDVEKFVVYKKQIPGVKSQENANTDKNEILEKEFTEEEIKVYIEDFKNNNLSQNNVIFSESLEAKSKKSSLLTNGFKYIIGNEWQNMVINNNNSNILLLLCNEKISDCEKAISILKEAHTFLFDDSKNAFSSELLVYISDPLLNEITHIHYKKSPSLHLIKKGENTESRFKEFKTLGKAFHANKIVDFIIKELFPQNYYFKDLKEKNMKDYLKLKSFKLTKKDISSKHDVDISSDELDNIVIGLRRTIDIELEDIDNYLDKISSEKNYHDDL